MKHSCTLCGSRNWPDPDTDCPLCYGPAEAGPDPDEDDPDHDSYDDERYDEKP